MEKHYLPFDFEVKKKGGNKVTIEGYANAATVDRMKERIDPKGWDLENYKKNPIMLFDHGHDPQFGSLPIGSMTMVEAKEDGLYCKGQLSNSPSEKISAVRDLVNEGILKTFSVGFAAKDSKSDPSGEVNEITSAELIEISIVPIPMNQDSTFSLLSKRFGATTNKAERVWLQRAIERAKLSKKGAWVASAVQQQIYNLQETGELTDKDATMKYVAELSGVTPKELTSILAGDVTPVPVKVIDALSTVLRIDKSLLITLDKGDVSVLAKIAASSSKEAKEGKSMPKKTTSKKSDSQQMANAPTNNGPMPSEEDVKPEPKPGDEAPAKKAAAQKVGVEMLKVPKDSCEDLDEAKEMVSKAGYSTDSADEGDDTNYLFPQPGEWDMESDSSEMDVGDGVVAVLRPVKSAPKSTEADEQKAACEADGKMEDDKKEMDDDIGLDKDQLAKLAEAFKLESEAAVAGGEGNPPTWVADESLWDKAKKVSEAALGEVSYPFVVWWYIQNEGAKKAMPKEQDDEKESNEAKGMGSPDGADASDDNPYLNLAKQQLVMLAQVVGELQKLGTMLQGLPKVTVDAAAEAGKGTTVEQPVTDDAAKSFDILKRFHADIDTRLKSLGC